MILTGGYWTVVIALLLTGSKVVNPQSREVDNNLKFYMDQTSDCNGPIYNILKYEARIVGQKSADTQNGPLSCTIQLKSEKNYERTIMRVTVERVAIRDEDVNLVIYDGKPDQPLLQSFDYTYNSGRRELFSTGNQVSLVLTRRDQRNTKYDIELVVSPLPSGTDPGYENDNGGDYGFFNRLVPNMVIYIIVGVLFFIVIIIIIVVVIVCRRKQQGLNKKPEEYKLSYITSTMPMSQGPPSKASTKNWVNTSRNSLRDRKPRHHSDDDSVFDGSDVPSKRRYDPDRSYENTTYSSRNARSAKQNYQPSYRNDSFVQADDDHPQDVYIEREMKPRVKSIKRVEEAEEDEESIGVGPDEEEEEEESDEEDKEEDTEEEVEEEETEEEEEEELEVADPHLSQPPPQNIPEHPPPRLGHPSQTGIPQPTPRHLNQHDQPHFYPGDPRQIPVNGPYRPQFMMYPGQPRPQFMPIAPGPAHFQPIQGPYMNRPPPPQYQGQPNQTKSRKPNEPPVYSHVVQRGYNPEDGRTSPASVSTNASAHSNTRLIQPEDSDMSAHNLDAGVEYMKR